MDEKLGHRDTDPSTLRPTDGGGTIMTEMLGDDSPTNGRTIMPQKPMQMSASLDEGELHGQSTNLSSSDDDHQF
jgi:hypothetical protein